MTTTFAVGGTLEVNRLGLGALYLTGPGFWGKPNDVPGARALLRKAVDLGVNLVDTADSYGPQVNERLIAEALHPYPSDLLIATKGGMVRSGPNRWRANGRPEHLRAACESSLRRLRIDRIHLYQLHQVDDRVPLEESVGALADLQREGKLAYVGLSNVSVGQLRRARRVVPITTVQNRYHILDRQSDDVLDACAGDGIGFLPWEPLAGGALARSGAIGAVAARHGVSPAQVALAWLLHRSPVTLPIPGTASIDHLEQNVAAAGLALDGGDLAALNVTTVSRRSPR